MPILQTEVILRHGSAELARVTLPLGEYVIGREAGVHLRADTPLLSRKHARLTINHDHLLIEDLGSSNMEPSSTSNPSSHPHAFFQARASGSAPASPGGFVRGKALHHR